MKLLNTTPPYKVEDNIRIAFYDSFLDVLNNELDKAMSNNRKTFTYTNNYNKLHNLLLQKVWRQIYEQLKEPIQWRQINI